MSWWSDKGTNSDLVSVLQETRLTLTPTCRTRRQTARMNWWVNIRKQSAAPKASGGEQRQPLTPNTWEVSAGRAGRSTALWLLTMMDTAARPRRMMVSWFDWDSSVDVPLYNEKLWLYHRFFCTYKHKQAAHTDAHCQLIQGDDQSEAPTQHTLCGRVAKQSTVCIICRSLTPSSHLPFPICWPWTCSSHLVFICSASADADLRLSQLWLIV